MKIVNALRDNFASEVLPGAAADPIARIDGWLALGGLCAQIGTPSLVACTGALRTKNVMLGDCGGGCCASASKHPAKSTAADATKPRPIAVFIPSLSYFDQDFP